MLKIKEYRMAKGLKQEELAQKINVKNYTIGNWEQGRSRPLYEDLIALADYFGCTTDELLGRENYATGNIEIIGEKVADDEKEILAVYRALNADGKKAFLSMVKNLATLNNVAVKIS